MAAHTRATGHRAGAVSGHKNKKRAKACVTGTLPFIAIDVLRKILWEMINPYFHKLMACIRCLSRTISAGQYREVEIQNGDEPIHTDERTHGKFLEIMDEIYRNLSEVEPEHLDPEHA
ncbi:hypothetical protein SISSUDRAFT_1064845 [Sistotremastrum suecicum HHB10207 ss-3]|uniref:Uncharacterized protein n=1 Tax=Sistotremastrum suecicum HHB10207 ss-3 TaxID=1314776 RepID=A0A166A5Z3_9AGAM|nr:hypothetical protein SISSUDRAFT_1064845 [Sistotremastrum suecicum HHB10207 ss-3]